MSTNARLNSLRCSADREVALSLSIDDFADRHVRELEALLPRVTQALTAVVKQWSDRHPELVPLNMIFESFRSQLECQLRRESRGMLGLARRLAVSNQVSRATQDALRHAMHSAALEMAASLAEGEAMRRLAMDFCPPSHADLPYVRAYRLLAELYRRLRARFDTAEGELFPAIEQCLARSAVEDS